jgi:hypothetical protein
MQRTSERNLSSTGKPASPGKPASEVATTSMGVTRRHACTDGKVFLEFTSRARIFGIPLIHRTRGVDPQSGKRIVAKGIIAIGRTSVGVLAVGQIAVGLVAVGQMAFGLLFCLAHLEVGMTVIGQVAIGGLVGIGCLSTGFISVGQITAGWFSVGQFALSPHGIDMRGADPVLVQLLQSLKFW